MRARFLERDRPLGKAALIASTLLLVSACSKQPENPTDAATAAAFVGSQQCRTCHTAEYSDWQGSHHQLAMQVASPDTVLGDFSDASLPYFDTTARFSTRAGKHFITAQNARGVDEEFEVTHTFGVYPLQQYLVEAQGGRKQALQFIWDSRDEGDGGQRWYHLYPDEFIGAGDPLHWTGRYFNWNAMCAECHSTDLQLNYDVASDSFDTSYSEISVGCESCHGPGAGHIAQASANTFDADVGLPIAFDERRGMHWAMNPSTGIAQRSQPNTAQQEVESCGRCHARRGGITPEYEYGTTLSDTHMLSLLDEGLYHADGRIQDEVYVYGSFVQSKMYAAGVTCSDCHNPHSGQLRAGPDPNVSCAQCHLPAKFASAEHNQKQVGDCVACHMPATTYMGVDDRRDHSFRLPDTAIDPTHYGAAIAAGRLQLTNDRLENNGLQNNISANELLLDGIANVDYPAIARATMLSLLEPITDPAGQALLIAQLDNAEPLIRIGALRALQRQPSELPVTAGSHLLRDPVRAVRIEAASTYAGLTDLLPIEDSRAFNSAATEYSEALRSTAAMPLNALSLAEFEQRLNNSTASKEMYEHAIRIGPEYAAIQMAYGLHQVRAGRPDNALPHLKRANELASDDPRIAYTYGVALNSLGHPDAALTVLREARGRFPDNVDIAWALATMLRDRGANSELRALLEQLQVQFPADSRLPILADSLPR